MLEVMTGFIIFTLGYLAGSFVGFENGMKYAKEKENFEALFR
jgi:hypothetical protein